MRQIVIVIADLYFPPGEGEGLSTGAPAGSLPGFAHVARFGEKTVIADGWRAWLARWLDREDFANATPATIASAALDRHVDAETSLRTSVAEQAAPTLAPRSASPSTALDANAGTDASSSTAWIATPVHLIAGLTSLHLDRRSILRLSRDDLESFAYDFTRVFAGSGFTLEPLSSGEFLLFGPNTPRTVTTEPARALVGDLGESLPKGADAPVLKRLGAELEMWLHEHPINEARTRRGEPPVSTLWLWGGGPAVLSRCLSRAAPARSAHAAADFAPRAAADFAPRAVADLAPRAAADFATRTAADLAPRAAAVRATRNVADPPPTALDLAFGPDPYLAGLWHLNGGEVFPLPDQLATVFSYPRAQRAALVAEVAPMLHANPRWTVFEVLADLDRRFVSPALVALRRGDVESLVLVANDRQLVVRRHDRLKLWRRPHLGIEALR